MRHIKPISNPLLIAIAALSLAACGGGGSSGTTDTPNNNNGSNGGSSTSSTVSKMTAVNGFRVNYTPNGSSYTGFTGKITSPISYTNLASIDTFTIADAASPAHTYSQTGGSSFSAGTFATVGSSNLGGTTYSYGRFGWLGGQVTEADSSTSVWYTPYALASSTPTTPGNLNYAGTQQALVYVLGDYTSGLSGASGYSRCDTSASYTASSKTLQLTLSNCSTGVGYTISGGLSLTNGGGTTTLMAQQPSIGATTKTVTSATVDSGNFLLAGPNGEELVGAATIKGTIALTSGAGSSNPAIFLVVFGGKKQ